MRKEKLQEKNDLRIRRTHKLLLDSLILLLEEKSLEEISVIEICDKAMVHRTTFYKHFNDKYHLLEFGLIELIKSFHKTSNFHGDFSSPKLYYMYLVKNAAKHLSAYKKRSLSVMIENTSNSFMGILHGLLVEEIKILLENNEKEGFIYHVPIPIIAEFHAGALISLAKWWLKNNISISEEEFSTCIDLMINEGKYVSPPQI